ncbi:MAG: hypothetical protein AB9835_07300 [Eubacteriales bacterium]
MVRGINKSTRFRVFSALLLAALFGGYVIYNLVSIQLVNFKSYQEKAIRQQMSETSITPKRGTIYDRNMLPLAESNTVERVFISPAEIDEQMGQLVAAELSRILEVDKSVIRGQAAQEKTQGRDDKKRRGEAQGGRGAKIYRGQLHKGSVPRAGDKALL